jgi:hypothetical protein
MQTGLYYEWPSEKVESKCNYAKTPGAGEQREMGRQRKGREASKGRETGSVRDRDRDRDTRQAGTNTRRLF